MTYKIINIDVPKNPYVNRHFCVNFNGAFLKHLDFEDVYPKDEYVFITHEGKKVLAGIDKELQKVGNKSIIYGNKIEEEIKEDEEINEEVFLLYDNAGVNYIHFFFDMFGRCFYFEKLLKQNPNLKLGIPEDYYLEEGKSNFIKQWLDIYLEDKKVDILVLKKNKTYRIKSLIVSNLFYWFPEQYGNETILDMIKEVSDRVEPIKVNSTGAYISRQDTLKRGWYHTRELINELELIDTIKSKLNYDIIEMMDYNIKEKIQICKSYKTIIQQSSASNLNILFASPGSNSVILTNPRMGPWLNAKCQEFSNSSRSNLLIIEDIGECITEGYEHIADKNNYPWKISDINGLVDLICSIDNGSVWN